MDSWGFGFIRMMRGQCVISALHKAPPASRANLRAWVAACALALGGLTAAPVQAAVDFDLRVSPASAAPGDIVSVAMTVANTGAGVESDLSVVLEFPSGIDSVNESLMLGPFDAAASCASAGSSTVCSATEPLVWTLPTLGPGGAVVLEFPVAISAGTADGTGIDFTAELFDQLNLAASQSDTLSTSLGVIAALAIDEDKDPVPAGDVLSYTVRYGNPSGTTISASALTLTLAANTSFVSASGGGSHAGGVVTWSLGTLSAGATGQQQVQVLVDAGAGAGTVLPVAAAFDGTANFLPTSQQVSEAAYVNNPGPLALSLNVNASPAAAGEAVLLSMNLANTTASQVFDAQVLLRYPGGVDSVNESVFLGGIDAAFACDEVSSSTVCSANEFVIFSIPVMNPGQVKELSFPVGVSVGSQSGRMVGWEARVIEANGSEAWESITLALDNGVKPSLAIDEDKDPVAAGDTLTYTVRYGNPSGTSISNSGLSLSLPADSAFVSASDGGVHAAGTVTWSLGTLPAGATGERQVSVQVDALAGFGTLLPASAVLDGTANFLPTSRRVSETGYVSNGGPLALSLNVNPAPAAAGEAVLVSMNLANTTASPVFDAQVIVRYPGGVDSVNESLILGALDAVVACDEVSSSTVCSVNEFVIFTLPTLNPGQVRELSFPVNVSVGTAPGTLVPWKARIAESNGSEAWESATLRVDNNVAPSLAIDEDKDPVAAGELLSYTVRYGNPAGTSISALELSLTLPADTSFVSASGGGVHAGGVVTWSLGTLAAGANDQQIVQVQVAAGATPGTLLPVFGELEGSANFLPAVRHVSEAGYVGPGGPLALSLSVNPSPAAAGEATLVSLNVANTTASPVFDAQVILRYPQGVDSVSESLVLGELDAAFACDEVSSSTVCSTNEFVILTLPTLNPGQVRVMNFPVNVSVATAPGQLIRWRARMNESNGAEAWEVVTLPVSNGVAPTLGLDEDKDPVSADDVLTYRLRYGNPNGTAIDSNTLSLTLPEGTSFVAATGGGVSSGQQVTWALGTLPAGAIGQRAVQVQVSESATPGTLLPASAALTGTANFATAVRRISEAGYVGAGSPLRVLMGVNPVPAAPGELAEVNLNLTNPTANTVFDAQVVLRYPLGVDALNESEVLGGLDAAISCDEVSSSTVCSSNEFLIWNFAQVLPGEVLALSVPSNVSLASAQGSLIGWLARTREAGGSEAWRVVSLPVGNDVGDADSDGIGNSFDNCIVLANADQRDTNGDGYGNRCDGDFDNNGNTDFADLALMKEVFFTPSADEDMDGNGSVDFGDLAVLKSLFFMPPGPSSQAP